MPRHYVWTIRIYIHIHLHLDQDRYHEEKYQWTKLIFIICTGRAPSFVKVFCLLFKIEIISKKYLQKNNVQDMSVGFQSFQLKINTAFFD